MENASQTESILRNLSIFSELNDNEVQNIVAHTKTIHVKAQDILFKEGDIARCLYVVLSGSVQIFTNSKNGSQVLLANRKVGDFFGEQALLPGHVDNRRNASAIATENSQLLEIYASEAQFVQQSEYRYSVKT